jgi:hypothetical protein
MSMRDVATSRMLIPPDELDLRIDQLAGGLSMAP